jgi:hypothetical protein
MKIFIEEIKNGLVRAKKGGGKKTCLHYTIKIVQHSLLITLFFNAFRL